LKNGFHGCDPPLQTLGKTHFLCFVSDDEGVMRKSLLGVGEEVLVVLKRGRGISGGDRRSRRRGIEVVLILVLDSGGESRLLGLDRALDDGVVGLDLVIDGRIVLSIENGAVALARHGLGVKGVDGALGELVDRKDAGLLEAKAVVHTPVTVVGVDV